MKTNKEEILIKSLTLIREKGYFNTSMKDLAEVNSLFKSSFYHYFKSKEQLMEEALKLNDQYLDTHLISVANNNELGENERLITILDSLFHYFTTVEGGCIMGNTAIETAGIVKQFEPILMSFFDKMVSAFTELFKSKYGHTQAKSIAERFVKEFQGVLMLFKLYKDPKMISDTLNHYKELL